MREKRKKTGSTKEPSKDKAMKKIKKSPNESLFDISLSKSSSCSSLNSIRTFSQEDIHANTNSGSADSGISPPKDGSKKHSRKSLDSVQSPSAPKANSSLVDYSDSSDEDPSQNSTPSQQTIQWTGGSVYSQLKFLDQPPSWVDKSFDSQASTSTASCENQMKTNLWHYGSNNSISSSTSDLSSQFSPSVYGSSLHLTPDVFHTPFSPREPRSNFRRWSSSGSIEKLTTETNHRFLSPVRRCSPSVVPSYNSDELNMLQTEVGVVDTHCHIDFLFRRMSYTQTYDKYREENSATFPVCYEGCLAIFCDPATFAESNTWQKILDCSGVWAAFGCHPHMAHSYDETAEHYLQQCITHEKVVALGEIGLDYSTKNNCGHDVQKTAFKRQLEIALKNDLPLVIHCRDADTDCLAIMKEMVPMDYRIHRHCFTGDWLGAQMWLEAFPNLYLGLTALVTFPSAKEVHDVATNIPLERLLLETDTPYFVPKAVQGAKWSHPGMVIHVAAQIAAIKKTVSINDVLRAARHNTRIMYGI